MSTKKSRPKTEPAEPAPWGAPTDHYVPVEEDEDSGTPQDTPPARWTPTEVQLDEIAELGYNLMEFGNHGAYRQALRQALVELVAGVPPTAEEELRHEIQASLEDTQPDLGDDYKITLPRSTGRARHRQPLRDDDPAEA